MAVTFSPISSGIYLFMAENRDDNTRTSACAELLYTPIQRLLDDENILALCTGLVERMNDKAQSWIILVE